MSAGGTWALTFQATPPEVFAALREAARRSGFQYLSGDAGTGTAVFTSGRFLLSAGEKVTVRMKQVTPTTVEVTLASAPKFGVVGWAGRRGARADQLGQALSGLLPHAG